MKGKLSIILDKAEALLQADKYNESLNVLNSISESNLSSIDKGRYYLLKGENCLFLGEYKQDYLDKAIRTFKFSSEHILFAKAKYLKGWQLQSLGNYIDAKEAILESYTAFIRVDEFKLAGRALNRISLISYLNGDIEQSISTLKKSIDCYLQAGKEDLVVKARNNLATVLYMTGNLNESLQLLKKSKIILNKIDNRTRCNYFIRASIIQALLGEIENARKLIKEASLLVKNLKREKAIYNEYLGWISILDKDYPAAENALKRGLEISLEIAPESALVSQIKRLMGDVYVATKRYDLAEKTTNEALTVARKINERNEIAACYRIYAQLELHKGNKDKARRWFTEAIALFNLISSRYELAVTRLMAVSNGLYDNGEKTAMLYLAREYFVSENLKHLIAKVDAELKISKISVVKTNIRKETDNGCPTIIATCSRMKKILEFANHIAQSEMTILLTGETGTGKDLLARYIHYHSKRSGRFVAVNAAAIPNDMIEAELFGYRKGAFTGADIDKPGLFEEAHNGTFYLNEIADATPEFQAKLLEVLETHCVRRLGENKNRSVKFRLITATNHNLKQRMNENKFRCDLFHRLNEIPIHLPLLNERTDDISSLVQYFLKESGFDILTNGGSTSDLEFLIKILSEYNWDGNIRQLKSVLKHLLLVSNGNIKEMIKLAQRNGDADGESELVMALNSVNGNKSKAARILGLHESTFRYRLRKQKYNF